MSAGSPVSWAETARDGAARTGWLDTPHGRVATPLFMPVGTRAAVKAVSSEDLLGLRADMVLANTYHLMLRPGVGVIESLGGLHRFMNWDGPILTDSGGFQIFSLDADIDDDGATFRSVYDGSIVRMTPEDAMRAQQSLGPDIAMALDVCVALPADRGHVEAEMQRTLSWARRCAGSHQRWDQALFGIVQGGVDPDLRSESARRTAEIGFAGFGIGGLSVGEGDEERNRALEAVVDELPDDKPRYVMGLGDPRGLLEAIARGADIFDCVLPTRLARHGKVLTRNGDFSLRNARFEIDTAPLEEGCACWVCAGYSRGYLRHLLRMNEITAHRMLSVHNLHYILELMRDVRMSIAEGRFGDLASEVLSQREDGSS